MSKERLKSPRLRLFVALELPQRVRDLLVRWQLPVVAGEPGLRPVTPESLHITLAFLGYQPERRLEAIAAAAMAPEARHVSLAIAPEPVPVPDRGRPRLFAASCVSEDAVKLQAEVSASLQAGGFYEPERRPFWPHVTVARVRPDAPGSRRPRHIESPPNSFPDELSRPFEAVRLTLYRSVLRREGAEYTPMAQLELPAGAGGGEETRDGRQRQAGS